MENDKVILRALRGEALEVPPLWLMRQAGRYLPEYRALRAKAKSFLELCLTPDIAEEITLQPVRRFGFDAAILFADILLVPYALGQKLWFQEGEGPRLEPLTVDAISGLTRAEVPERLAPVFETIRRLRKSLAGETTLIGFAGAPWTVATYMIAGAGSDDSAAARLFALKEPKAFARLIDVLVDATVDYLVAQVSAGAEVLQLFESWAATIPAESVAVYSIDPLTRIVEGVRAKASVPIIVFPRGAGSNYLRYDAIGADALSLDTHVLLDSVVGALKTTCLQGNLDPFRLIAGGKALEDSVRHIRRAMSGRPFIFNLGHGIRQETPVEHVQQLVRLVREKAA
ncbi:MAG: uroporphyrinogen decarboxylase [Alphaproteobacteria bacterium]|nr:uroporphyrinogen decarboxylase [Alphaproteobacteria bacterium]